MCTTRDAGLCNEVHFQALQALNQGASASSGVIFSIISSFSSMSSKPAKEEASGGVTHLRLWKAWIIAVASCSSNCNWEGIEQLLMNLPHLLDLQRALARPVESVAGDKEKTQATKPKPKATTWDLRILSSNSNAFSHGPLWGSYKESQWPQATYQKRANDYWYRFHNPTDIESSLWRIPYCSLATYGSSTKAPSNNAQQGQCKASRISLAASDAVWGAKCPDRKLSVRVHLWVHLYNQKNTHLELLSGSDCCLWLDNCCRG